jgi:hypothetical protein
MSLPPAPLLDWRWRTVFNATIVAALIAQLCAVAARAGGGGSQASWGIVLLPLWVVDFAVLLLFVHWASEFDRARYSGTQLAHGDAHPDDAVPLHMPTYGVVPVFENDVPTARAEWAAARLPVNAVPSLVLYTTTLALMVPASVVTKVLLVVHLQTGSPSLIASFVPAIVWLSLLLLSVTLRPVWRRGYTLL